MSNYSKKSTPYERGRLKEYEAIKLFQSAYARYVMRSAGSHTPIDFIAGNGVETYAVQVRYGRKPKPVNVDELREWAQAFNAIPVIMQKKFGGKWRIIFVDSEECE